MARGIERVLYYDGEYLRSFDFAAEQAYHIEMRRRLNLALHLYGIVQGLDVLNGPLSVGTPSQFYVSPGMAIDAMGREIIVPAPVPLDDTMLRENKIHSPGTYPLWIVYTKEPARPPSAGYGVCNKPQQFTRWREGYKLIIGNNPTKTPATDPNAWEALSDDPAKTPQPLFLGSVEATLQSGTLAITQADTSAISSTIKRVYIATRTQRIIAPVASLDHTDDDFTLPIGVEEDLQAEQNLIVGDALDPIKPADVEPPPTGPFPPPTGTTTTHTLLVSEGLYLPDKNPADPSKMQWVELKDYLKRITPEVKFMTQEIDPTPENVSPSSDVISILAQPDNLKFASKATAIASISGIEWDNWIEFFDWLGDVDPNQRVVLNASISNGTLKPGTSNQFTFNLTWSVGPTTPAIVNKQLRLNVKKLYVALVFVFWP